MSVRKPLALLVVIAVIPFINLHAQDSFSPDRPGLGNGSYVLPTGTTYLESGLEYYDGGAVDQFSFGQVMFRRGLMQGVEFRVLLNSFVVETRPIGSNQTGAADPAFGVKFNLYNNTDSYFTLSGLGSVSIPAGYSPYTDNKWHPSATLLGSYQLSEYWSVTSNVGYTFGPGDTPGVVTITVTPGFSIPNSNFSGYFGYAGFISDTADQHFIEAGLTDLITPSIQVDINAGADANSGDAFIGTGFAIRF